MLEIRQHCDAGSLVIIVATLTLFLAALLTTGLTHDILLEAAVFLVSVKLVVMSYKAVDATDSVHCRLDEFCDAIKRIESHATGDDQS